MRTFEIPASLRPCRTFIACAWLLALATTPLAAADKTWDGGGDGVTWTLGANWDADTAPVATDALFFGGNVGLFPNNDFAANTVFNGITFNAGAGAFSFSGNAVRLGGGVTNNSTGLQTFNLNIDNNGTRTWDAAAGPILLDGVMNNSIVKTGTNTVTLAGVGGNTGTPTATVNAGTLVLAKPNNSQNAIVNPCIVNAGGTLVILGPGTDQIHFNTRVSIQSGGVLDVQNTEEIGMLDSAAGSGGIVLNNSGVPRNLNVGGGSNHRGIFSGSLQDGTGVLNYQLGRNGHVQVFNGTNTYTGTTTVVNNQSGQSPSRLIVNGTHTGGGNYTISSTQLGASLCGTGSISAAVVNFNAGGTLSPGGTLSANSDAGVFGESTGILTLNNNVNLNAANSTLDVQLNGATAGSGYDRVVIGGGGVFSNNNANLKLTLGFTPANNDQFTIVVVDGTDSGNTQGAFATLNGVATDLSQGATFVEPTSGKNFRISYRAEGSTFDAGEGNGNDIMLEVVAPAGGQEVTWRGDVNSDWDIATTANWRAAGVSSTFTNGDFVVFDDSGSNNTPINLTTLLSPATILFNASKDYEFGGFGGLSGTVVITKTNTGTLTITTENSNAGSTLVNQGTLQVGTNGTSGTLSGALSINAAGHVAHNRSDDVAFSVAFTGPGSFTHIGSGTLILTNDSPFTGRMTNSGGLLQLGDGTGSSGSIAGDIHVPAANTLRYFHNGDIIINHSISGSGAVSYEAAAGNRTFTIAANKNNIDFTGSLNLFAGVRLHASDNNVGYNLGNGSAVTVPDTAQVWLDRSATTYNQSFTLSGIGWTGEATPLGAMRIFGCTVSGPVALAGDTRIGGTINGGTISGQITGNFQLEVLGNVNSFILGLGPTNGPNQYGATLITSGALRALNPGGVSTNAMSIDLNGQLQLNGNNLSVASLNNGINGPGVVLNINNAAPAVLTVGANGASTSFDGVFGDGGAQSLGLAKVGAGTLTLSGDSTNTGPVTVNSGTLALTQLFGSGSFNNASVFTVAAGATLDVNGRLDQTLTLNSGQTLQGDGLLNGNLAALSGSVVAPGSSVGSLTVQGNATLGGTLLMELDRGGSPNNSDRLNVSGSVTYGGNLVVTNIGSALQVNDTFQLFPAGVGGFGAINIATKDANNMVYTWQNDIATLGSIKVLTAVPGVSTAPVSITAVVNGSNLDLSWPADHTGWDLQVQTNGVNAGLSTNWVTVLGSSATNHVVVPINPATGAVFYRLHYLVP